jgi:triacylglycerol lipase
MNPHRSGTAAGSRPRPARLRWFLALFVAGIGLMLGPGMAAAATPNYPVPYTFTADILASPSGPNTPPPGANNWSCRPSATHPNPVILVHGLFANETDNWQTYGPLLADNGYCVFSLTYGNDLSTSAPLDNVGGLIPMEQSAEVLGSFVNQVLAATGARKVDIVGHSEGATMPYWYIKFDGGAAKVARMVGLAPVVHGTATAIGTAVIDEFLNAFGGSASEATAVAEGCQSCAEFAPESSFIQQLDAGGVAVPGVVYTQIMTTYDELVVPYTSGMVVAPRSTNFVVQDQCALDFADHIALAADPVAAQDVLNALDPAAAQPVPCVPVAPVISSA